MNAKTLHSLIFVVLASCLLHNNFTIQVKTCSPATKEEKLIVPPHKKSNIVEEKKGQVEEAVSRYPSMMYVDM